MKIKSRIISLAILAVTALMAASCVTNKQIAYLQDMTHNTQIELENKFEAVVSPYDELDIVVTCFDNELAKPFNIGGNSQATAGNYTARNLSYLVDQYGNIEMPVLGTIHAAGMTRLKLQEKVRQMLIDGGYISDPFVMVRFRDYKIFFLGSNGGKAITIPNERCTFLEALALSGDLNQYTNRRKIAVMREVNGRMVMRYLDPRSSKIFQDPYYMLQQNDFIITQDVRYKNFLDSFRNWTPILSVASTVVGVVSAYLTYQIYSRTN